LILSNRLGNTFTNSRMISIMFYVHSAKPTSVNLLILHLHIILPHNIYEITAKVRSYILFIKIILYNIII